MRILSFITIANNITAVNAFASWSTVFEVLFGAVIALISSGITGWITRKIHVYQLIKKLRFEINDNLQKLQEIEKNSANMYRYDSPIWDQISSTNVLLEMSSDTYKKLVTIYSEVKKFNQEEEDMYKNVMQDIDIDIDRMYNRRSEFIRVLMDNQL